VTTRSLVEDNRQIRRAIELIGLGARLQMLQSETDLPYERLLRLYKEVTGKSPSKGQLPFSTDWFVAWQPNVHASLFFNIYDFLLKSSPIDEVDAIMRAYRLYLRELELAGIEPVMSITRAWRLVRFLEAGMLCSVRCTRCGGAFLNHTYELNDDFVCGLCRPPARAGKAPRPRAPASAH
jgi:flagellar transcriptional activator FlhC